MDDDIGEGDEAGDEPDEKECHHVGLNLQCLHAAEPPVDRSGPQESNNVVESEYSETSHSEQQHNATGKDV